MGQAEVLGAMLAVYDWCSLTGGCLHIVLDDGNMEDRDIRWCIEHGNDGKGACGCCLWCAHLLLELSEEERRAAVKKLDRVIARLDGEKFASRVGFIMIEKGRI